MADSPIDVATLTEDQRLALIGELWDSLAQNQLPPPSAEQLRILEDRALKAAADPGSGRSWAQVREKLERRIK